MSRLVGLPELNELMTEIRNRPAGIRIGQFVWNKYGQRGVDGEGWPELFYADDEKAVSIITNYYAQ